MFLRCTNESFSLKIPHRSPYQSVVRLEIF
jgi:hypothetical protein